MKNLIYSIISCLLVVYAGFANAQTPSGRTASTVITDVLTQQPAERSEAYEQYMKELIDSGTDGVKRLVSMRNAPGKGDNSAIDYALSGMAHYATSDESLKNKIEQAFLAVIDETNEPETVAFIIRLLAITGSETSINKLSGYLTDEKLCSPAATSIVSIGGELAGKALQMALMRRVSVSPEVQRYLIQALGEVNPVIAGTEELLRTMVTTNDITTKRIVLKALSQTGTKLSLSNLAAAAASTGYKAEITNANDACLRLIKRVYEQGDTKEALAAAQSLMKNATKSGSNQLRIAALEILFFNQKDVIKTLKTALQDGNKAYRNAALRFASGSAGKALYTELFKSLPKAKTEQKIDILYWIENEAKYPEKNQILKSIETGIDKTGTQTLIQLLNDRDNEVKQAAAVALGAIGDKIALPALTDMLKSQDSTLLACIRDVLSTFPADITPAIAKAFSPASDAGKIIIMELLSGHKANTYFYLVLEQTGNSTPEIRDAAYKTLKDVVSEKDFIVLCGMLETSQPSFIQPLQQAISSTIASLTPEKQLEMISNRMLQAGDIKQYLYYPVLASTNNPTVLTMIVRGFYNGNSASQEAAFEALASWKGFEVEEALYTICKSASPQYVEKAVNAYIRLVTSVSLTGENRFIFLRKAMEVAQTDEQKNRLLRTMGSTGSFLALLYAGDFLDVTNLKDRAAQTVMEIALANPEFTGAQVKELLAKTALALDNKDADYQRQAIRKHLDEMPDETGFVSIFNGKDLTGWKGLVANPVQRAKMKPAELKSAQAKADEAMRAGWAVVNGELVFNGSGDNICTEKQYSDFEMYVDWKLDPAGPEPDAGIYLRGTPQVQIWDTSRVNVGAQVGSGGLYNNRIHPSTPLKVADNQLGEWNTFYIKMVDERVTVRLNGEWVVDNVILENYWDRSQPIPPIEQIELQAHGSKVYYRNIFIKELK